MQDLLQSVMTEMYVLLVEIPHQEELKFVSMARGEQCVMMAGIMMMPMLSAHNWDSQDYVSSCLRRQSDTRMVNMSLYISVRCLLQFQCVS